MDVQINAPQRAQAPRQRPRPSRPDNAPTDGVSHYNPAVAVWARPLNKLAMHLMFKQDYQGLEKLPTSGGHLLCPNHQAMVDAPLVASLTDRDNRFMAAKEQFVGAQGWLMRNVGAFPVDRKNPGPLPLEHSRAMLDAGKPVVMFPEGGIFRTGEVNPLKTGAARIATSSKCQSIVPITIHFQESDAPSTSRKAMGLAMVASVTALAAAGAYLSPTVRAITGGITGGLAGVHLGKKPLHKALFTAGGFVAGCLGGALSPPGVGALTALGTGVVSHKFDNYLAQRPTARVVVGDPLVVEDYVSRYGSQAEEHLTADLHTALNEPKVRMHAEKPSYYPI